MKKIQIVYGPNRCVYFAVVTPDGGVVTVKGLEGARVEIQDLAPEDDGDACLLPSPEWKNPYSDFQLYIQLRLNLSEAKDETETEKNWIPAGSVTTGSRIPSSNFSNFPCPFMVELQFTELTEVETNSP